MNDRVIPANASSRMAAQSSMPFSQLPVAPRRVRQIPASSSGSDQTSTAHVQGLHLCQPCDERFSKSYLIKILSCSGATKLGFQVFSAMFRGLRIGFTWSKGVTAVTTLRSAHADTGHRTQRIGRGGGV